MSNKYSVSIPNEATGTTAYVLQIRPQIWTTDDGTVGGMRAIDCIADFTRLQGNASNQIVQYSAGLFGTRISANTTGNCYGQYIHCGFTGAVAGNSINNVYGHYFESGGAIPANVRNFYGSYVKNPGGGTNSIAVYTDNVSIGYTGFSPATGTVFTQGPITIGSKTNTTSSLQVNGYQNYTYGLQMAGSFTGVDANAHCRGITQEQTYSIINSGTQSSIYNYYANPTVIFNAGCQGKFYNSYISATFASNIGTINTAYGMYIDSGDSASGTVTTMYGLYINQPVSGTNRYTANFNGPVGINNIVQLAALTVYPTLTGAYNMQVGGTLSGIDVNHQYCLWVVPTCTCPTGTTSVAGVYAQNTFQVPIGITVSNAYGMYVSNTHSGSGTTTNSYGLFVATNSCTNVSTSYGLYVNKPTNATSNYGAFIDGGVGIGATPPFTGIASAGNVIPSVDNTYTCGANGFRWSTVWAANGTIQTSDFNMKEDVQNEPLGLSFVNQLRPVMYKWKPQEVVHKLFDPNKNKDVITKKSIYHDRYHHGLIAQEVKSVLDFNNVPVKNAAFWIDSSVNDPDLPSTQGLNYAEFIPILIKAIQELKTRVELLESKYV